MYAHCGPKKNFFLIRDQGAPRSMPRQAESCPFVVQRDPWGRLGRNLRRLVAYAACAAASRIIGRSLGTLSFERELLGNRFHISRWGPSAGVCGKRLPTTRPTRRSQEPPYPEKNVQFGPGRARSRQKRQLPEGLQ